MTRRGLLLLLFCAACAPGYGDPTLDGDGDPADPPAATGARGVVDGSGNRVADGDGNRVVP